jgi:uncharacterized protein (TIGR02145 family)
MTGLVAATVYYVRAYATNSSSLTGYGSQIVFSTAMIDNDGNKYGTVVIGSQVWMAENLKTTKYNDGVAIPNLTVSADWIAENGTLGHDGAYCWYSNDGTTYKGPFGGLYNWYAVNTGKLCPTGWHAPTDDEFNTLEMTLGMTLAQVNTYGWRGTDQGSQLKDNGGWYAGEDGTNTSGFTAVPAGYRYYLTGTFNNGGAITDAIGGFWSITDDAATTAWFRWVQGTHPQVYKAVVVKSAGKSVRCVKD